MCMGITGVTRKFEDIANGIEKSNLYTGTDLHLSELKNQAS